MKNRITFKKLSTAIAVIVPLALTSVSAAPNEKNKKIFDHWTAERMANAIPRDLVIDKKGLGYIRRADGSLIPHGHNKLTALYEKSITPRAKPGGGGSDSTGPDVSPIEPLNGSTIGASQRFAASITDASGVRSASVVITFPNGSTQSFSASNSSGDVWENTLNGFTTDTGYSWHMVATDGSKGRGNSSSSEADAQSFDVNTEGGGGGNPGGDHSVGNAGWSGGAVQSSVGRIFFEMPNNSRRKRWSGYVCSGTVVTENVSGRSVIITASHCVYDDANKAFARNVLFIPNQDETTGTGTDSNCSNDPMGCWTTSFGVVDVNWADNSFPANIEWDYAYYVVNDINSHSGASASSDALDTAAGAIDIDFTEPDFDDQDPTVDSLDYTFGLGYSYSDDPNFMYCADDMTTKDSVNWWIPACDLSGGSSGGPWIQDMDTSAGDGPIISVNSWGYTDGSSGMAGPKLSGSTAECLFDLAKSAPFSSVSTTDGDAGIADSSCQ